MLVYDFHVQSHNANLLVLFFAGSNGLLQRNGFANPDGPVEAPVSMGETNAGAGGHGQGSVESDSEGNAQKRWSNRFLEGSGAGIFGVGVQGVMVPGEGRQSGGV